jgi:hypothetical protein
MLTALAIPLISFIFFFFLIQFLVRNERKKKKFYPFTEKFLRTPSYTLNKKLEDLFSDLLLLVMLVFLFLLYSISPKGI